MDRSRMIDNGYQNFCIENFANYFGLKIIESPIYSVTNKELGKNNGIPDAIILDENEHRVFVEHTSFSRCQEMQRQIRDLAKYPEKYDECKYINGISLDKYEPLSYGYIKAITQKLNKDYRKFSELANTEKKGILLITFLNNDPFFTYESFNTFIQTVQDDHFCNAIDFFKGCFDKIIFGANVPAYYKMELHFEVIHDSKSIQKIILYQESRKKLLNEINKRISHSLAH